MGEKGGQVVEVMVMVMEETEVMEVMEEKEQEQEEDERELHKPLGAESTARTKRPTPWGSKTVPGLMSEVMDSVWVVCRDGSRADVWFISGPQATFPRMQRLDIPNAAVYNSDSFGPQRQNGQHRAILPRLQDFIRGDNNVSPIAAQPFGKEPTTAADGCTRFSEPNIHYDQTVSHTYYSTKVPHSLQFRSELRTIEDLFVS
ncbi:hypothetical protein SODALDRAFT_349250 [Sodiomyces alkalinus F11]|uniref:Uncharacterized protein n=1 Tax=Sodiomyces alkalinus (strain CBS 110278 / VKM F-3762 / F11) TaxID=1314773 RepID=A0A3N2Q381_SODAK|nr:hypothetical protein SODALDRAFT_349250 [Sodiomyces alkalinus F11]ROT41202.1 hypothetical protein SODALDRAFT_349250 [Sodiomyces alkalinus F11]